MRPTKTITYTCDSSSSSSSEDNQRCPSNCDYITCDPKNNNNFLDLSAFLPDPVPGQQPLIIQPQTPQSLGSQPIFSESLSKGRWNVNNGNVTFNESGDYLITINMWFQQGSAEESYGAASTYITINGNNYNNVLKRSSGSASIVFLPNLFPINHTTSTFIVSLKRGDVVGFWATSLAGKQGAGALRAFSKSVLEDPIFPTAFNAPWYKSTITKL